MQKYCRRGFINFEWSHHRISSTDSKVRTTLHISIADSGTVKELTQYMNVWYSNVVLQHMTYCISYRWIGLWAGQPQQCPPKARKFSPSLKKTDHPTK